MNVYESGSQKVIPAVLIYAKAKGHVLMLYRTNPQNKEDIHEGKWNGLGGKLERGESPLEACVREFEEEAGMSVDASKFRALGTLLFPQFKAHKNEDWWVSVFDVDLGDLVPLKSCPEGRLEWVLEEKVLGLTLWPGDALFLPYVLKGRPFMGTLWYENGQLEKKWICSL